MKLLASLIWDIHDPCDSEVRELTSLHRMAQSRIEVRYKHVYIIQGNSCSNSVPIPCKKKKKELQAYTYGLQVKTLLPNSFFFNKRFSDLVEP